MQGTVIPTYTPPGGDCTHSLQLKKRNVLEYPALFKGKHSTLIWNGWVSLSSTLDPINEDN